MHNTATERGLFLAYDYTSHDSKELPTSQKDIAFWSAVAWLLRFKQAVLAAGSLLPQKIV